ncbi:MAG: hypothetical protein ABIW85_08125 [Variovorax sp.]
MKQIAILALMSSFSLQISASTIPDAPIPALEVGLEASENLVSKLAWIDNYTLLATAQIDAHSNFWERKVVQVDIRTSKTKDFVNPGALICTNAVEDVVSINVGSAASVYTGNSKEPAPQLKFYRWNRGKLTPKALSDNWNPYICKKTKVADTKIPGPMALAKADGIRYLESKDGYLETTQRQTREESTIALIRNEKFVATLQAKPHQVAPDPQYLAFRDEYILSSGVFVTNGSLDEARTTEYPLLTMTRSGSLNREYFRPVFERSGLTVEGQTFPYAKGTLIFVSNRPNVGGGIYLSQGATIKRVWCTNQGYGFGRSCQATWISMSPDGCHFAFFANSSDNLTPTRPITSRPTLKILPLCK